MIALITYSNNAIYFDRIHNTLSSVAASLRENCGSL